SLTASKGKEAFGQMLKDSREHFFLEPLTQFPSVIAAFQQEAVEKGKLSPFSFPRRLNSFKGPASKEKPEIAERFIRILLRHHLFQVDFVIVGRSRMGLSGVEAPQLSIGDNCPGKVAFLETTDHHRPGVLLRCLRIPFLIFPIQRPGPGIDQGERDLWTTSAARRKKIVGFRGSTSRSFAAFEGKAERSESRLDQPGTDHFLFLF